MAGTQRSGDGPNIAGMSKDQLYDIMFQMKSLIEQNQQQARQILTQNPLLTKGLFQAQIMLGMVKPPQVVPNIRLQVPQNPQQTVQSAQKSNAQPAPMISGQVGMQSSAVASQVQVTPTKRHQDQPSLTTSSSTAPVMSHQLQSTSTNPLQLPHRPVRPLNPPVPPMSLPESSHLPNIPAPLSHSSQPLNQLQNLAASGKSQQTLDSAGFSHLPSQQPLPQQVRPSPTPAFHSQYPPKTAPNFGPQHGSTSHKVPQSTFQPGTRAAGVRPIVSQGELSVSNLPPAQRLYQGGAPHVETKFNHQMGNPMQVGTGSSFMPSSSVQSSIAGHLGQQPMAPDLNSRPSGTAPALSPEMERQLLQQVMNLTPEQLNLLPPEQRNQVLHLQQMLHK